MTSPATPDLRDIFPRSERARDYANYRADLCPYHDDDRPSLLIYSDGFNCKGCGISGTVWDYMNNRVSDKSILKPVEKIVKPCLPVISEDTVEEMRLNMTTEGLMYLAFRGINEDMIARWKLGMNPSGTEILIPVYEDGQCVNLKRRILNAGSGQDKYKSWEQIVDGKRITYGSNRLFNSSALEGNSNCIIAEGEFDCIVTTERFGWPCVTPTTGAGSWVNEWNQRFDSIEGIFIIPDRDLAGLRGAMRIAHRLGERRTYIVPLPGRIGNKGDLTDFWRSSGTRIELLTLISRATPAYAITKKSAIVREYESL